MNDPVELATPKRRGRGKEDQGSPAGESSNTKLKSPGKVTPRKRSSKNSTPKKNLKFNGIKEAASPDSARKIDLRLEAKLSAEENSRLFAGRQIHPFFSSWKTGKKSQEPADSEHGLSEAKREGGRTTCDPTLVHVFEDVQEDTSSLDWSDWTFLGDTTVVEESLNLPVLVGSVESLNFDNFLSASKPSHASISGNAWSCSNQLSIQPDNMLEISPGNAAVLASEQTICPSKLEEANMDLEGDEVCTVSGQAGIFRNSDAEPLSRFLQESMASYYRSCQNKAEGSLWINKYKPTKATEVCGNSESLNFLRDWLHLWRGGRYHSRKDSSTWDQSYIQDEDDDFNYSDSDYALKDINEEDSLENVLLITGPVGSGKSAAVYACAEEQGFEVLELNASDYRNGAAVKQYFGEALETHGFKRLLEQAVSSQNKTVKFPPAPTSPNGKAAEEIYDGVIDLTTSSNDGVHSPGGKSQRLHEKNNVFTCHSVQTLILVEDVDILFPEDHGCIAAIKHIAETAKGPIILTSNSNNVALPGSFIRLHVSFSLPLPDELLCHLYMVCVTEEVNISPHLLKKFIQSCDGDIRKTIMHLQFWFQNKKYRKYRKVKTVYSSLPFDLEAGHELLPKILPWSFPSELPKLIEKEVSKSVTLMEENPCLQGLVEEELHINKKHNDLGVQCIVTDEANVEMKRKRSIADCNEFESQCSAMSELSNCYGSPLTPSRQMGPKKLAVMSSESEDKYPNYGHSLNIHHEDYKRQSLEGNSESSCKFELNQSYTSMSFCKLVCSGLENSEEQSNYLETSYGAWLDETHKSLNISSFQESMIIPETATENRTQTLSAAVSSGQDETHKSLNISSFQESMIIPETATENRTQTLSAAVSSGHLAGPIEVSPDNALTPFTFSVCQRIARLPQNLDSLVNTEIPESSPKVSVQDFRDENRETTTVYNMMGECSHEEFNLKLNFVESSPSMEIDMIQNLWRRLLDCKTDLRQNATSEQEGAIQVVKLASELTNLISEVDVLFRNHQQEQCGIMEPPIFLSDEATYSWYDEQMMMSTVAMHGFCFYAKHISDMGSKLGCENRVDVTSEMLASTTNIMALGKLSRQDHTKSLSNNTTKELDDMKSMQYNENRKSLFNVIQSIVPARLSLAMKGIAFNEYLSSLRQISVSEDIRMSQGAKKMRKGRPRGAHYLSRGKMFSPEDISLVCEGDLYRKISSQYTANMESNCA